MHTEIWLKEDDNWTIYATFGHIFTGVEWRGGCFVDIQGTYHFVLGLSLNQWPPGLIATGAEMPFPEAIVENCPAHHFEPFEGSEPELVNGGS